MMQRCFRLLTPLLGVLALLLPSSPLVAGNIYVGPNASVTYTFNPNQPSSVARVTIHQYPLNAPNARPYAAYPYGIGLYTPGAGAPYVPNGSGFYYGSGYSGPAIYQPTADYFGLGNNSSATPAPDAPPPAPVRTATVDPAPTNVATFELHLPADAQLYILGIKMNHTGAVRHFVSPPLQPGQYYRYELRATYMDTEKNMEVTKVRALSVRAGDKLEVLFTALPSSGSGQSVNGGASR